MRSLIRHETECAERWKHSFKQLDKLELAIARLQWWIIGGVTTVGVGFTFHQSLHSLLDPIYD